MKEADNAQDTDPMLTLWPDGSSWAVPQYTTGMHRAAVGTPKAAKVKGEIAGYDGQAVSIEMRWNAPKGEAEAALVQCQAWRQAGLPHGLHVFRRQRGADTTCLSRARDEVCEAGDE